MSASPDGSHAAATAAASMPPLPATPCSFGPDGTGSNVTSYLQQSQPATPATPAVSNESGTGLRSPSSSALAPPMPAALHTQLSRVELSALQLQRQYDLMLHSLQDSEKHLSSMTVHYVASLQQACKSSASSVGILIDTHTSLIRKTLIAVQQTAGIDELEKHIALTELEKGVEALVAEDALHVARQQLQAELAPQRNTHRRAASQVQVTQPAKPLQLQSAQPLTRNDSDEEDDVVGRMHLQRAPNLLKAPGSRSESPRRSAAADGAITH